MLRRVFIIRQVNFAKPARCSNCSKFVRSRVNIQVYFFVRFVQQGLLIAFYEIPEVCNSCFSVRVSQTGPLKGATAHESLRNTVPSDTDKSCQLIPQSGEEQQGNSLRSFQKHVQLLVQLKITPGCGSAFQVKSSHNFGFVENHGNPVFLSLQIMAMLT